MRLIPEKTFYKEPWVDRIGKPALLEQTAEECVELAHACLKEARRLRGENPTPKTTPECWLAISEELTDDKSASRCWMAQGITATRPWPMSSASGWHSALMRPESEAL